jgi:hypothetical protein
LTVERQRLRELAAATLRRLAEAQAAVGEFDVAVTAARHLVVLDDLNEDAHRLLMRILGQAGRRAEALRQFEVCKQTLRRELNIDPDAETGILAQSLRHGTRAGSALLPPQQPVRVPSVPIQQPVERRQVTVMSCKLDGLARLASEVEPEELGTEISFFRNRCREHISHFGGVISHVAGDGVSRSSAIHKPTSTIVKAPCVPAWGSSRLSETSADVIAAFIPVSASPPAPPWSAI